MNKAIETFLFVRHKRMQKKWRLIKMSLRVMLDMTTSIYLLIMLAYAGSAFFIFGDFVDAYRNFFTEAEHQMQQRFWFIFAIVPIRYVIASFQLPGVTYSTSETYLDNLAYKRVHIWMLCVAEKWLRELCIYVVAGSLIWLVTPFSASIIVMYLSVFMLYNICMVIPQWKLYQESFLVKCAFVATLLFIGTLSFLLASSWIGIIVFIAVLGYNVWLWPRLFRSIDWGRVASVGDFKIWNMRLVSRASKIDFQQQKQSIFLRSKRWRRPFRYTEKGIYSRLWFIYLGKNMQTILMLCAVLLFLLIVLASVSELYFHIGIAIAIFVYFQAVSIFFSDRMHSDILGILPLDLPALKQTFFRWVIIGGVVLFVPALVYGLVHPSVWLVPQWLFYGVVFVYMYHMKLDKAMVAISKEFYPMETSETLGLVWLVLIAISGIYPIAVFGGIACYLYHQYRRGTFSLQAFQEY